MNDASPNEVSMRPQARPGLALLLCLYVVACCLSLIYVADFYKTYQIIWFNKAGLYPAAVW